MTRTALILGAGIGGIVVAETLHKRLPAQDRVLVVERERAHVSKKTTVAIYSVEPTPMMIAGPAVGGMAGVGSGHFYAEPLPEVGMRYPNPLWHLGKVLYEKYWLWRQL